MKTKLFCLLLFTVEWGVARETPKPCCPPEAPPAELPAGAFTAESIYQLEVGFTADDGAAFILGRLRARPVILAMFFASCHFACPLVVADMTRIRDALPVELRGRVALVLVSFDPKRDTPAALHQYRQERLLDGQWILLHGSEDAVRELAALLGVKYKQETDGQFAHTNLISILNAEGEIVHHRMGLRGGLAEAAAALQLASGRP
jgi:protein SCO1/2